MAQKASLIIPTLNREEPLITTIESALKQDFGNYEVVMVDQSERHDTNTVEKLKRLERNQRLRIIHESVKSLPNARNVGLANSDGRYVIFVDDDVDLPVNFVRQHVQFMMDYGARAVGGRVLQEGKSTDSIPIRFSQFSRIKGDGFGGSAIREIDTFRGCNMAFDRSIFDQFGYFDINYTANAAREESDLALRIKKGGVPILFNPAAVLTHLEQAEGGCNSDNQAQTQRSENAEYFKNDTLFFLKHFHKVYFPIYVAGMYKAFVFKPWYLKNFGWLHQSGVVGRGIGRGLMLYIRLRLSRQLVY